MAAPNEKKVKTLLQSKETCALLVDFSRRLLTEHKKFSSYMSKMEAIDVAYARYTASVNTTTGIANGNGIDAATTPVGVMNMPTSTPPVVISQVDSMVGYLSEVFLSGTPMFPVVSSPENKQYAEQLETLLDDHATLGGYARQILMFLRDGIKYNFSAMEVDWTSIDQYTIVDEMLSPGTSKIDKTLTSFTKLKRLDPYNTVWDYNVSPGDVASEGDYAGYIEVMSRTKLKRMLQRLAAMNKAFNIKEALATSPYASSAPSGVSGYRLHPQVSDYVAARRPDSSINWFSYLGGKEASDVIGADNFEVFTFYARILPKEFEMTSPAPNTVQIWKIKVINSSVVVQAERIISAYDYLPILFGQPLEDGLGYQTQSYGEANIPFQTAAGTLFNIAFNSARRAVSDRALYNPDLISPSDINAPVPAAKIPVKCKSLSTEFRIQDAYHQIPFDARGTEGAIQSGMQIVSFGKELSGLNSPQQGQFQKGNKSVTEWNDTMGGSDARLRLPALTLEHQFFQPLKNIFKLNIFQYGEDAVLVSQKTGKEVKISIAELRARVLSFRVADGYTPKSKLASTEALSTGMQMLSQSQPLQMAYGPMLPGMFSHLMQLMGVRGLEEYTPQAAQAPQQPQQPQQPTEQGE